MSASIYYPQGNGTNESSHQALNKAIASMALFGERGDFDHVVRCCTLAYNATPHPAIGASPHYAMFGGELSLPGWQALNATPTVQQKQENLHAVRMDAAVRQVMQHHEIFLKTKDVVDDMIKPGDWVRWKLGGYEKLSAAGSAAVTTTHKLQPKWSLPAKVRVKDKVADLQLLGSVFSTLSRAPLTQLRLMPTELPRSLVHLNLENIAREKPIKATTGSGYAPSKPTSTTKMMLIGERGAHM